MSKNDTEIPPRRFGRPPKPAETVRSERVVSFVTPGELEQLEKISARRGVSLSAVIHSLVVRSLDSDTGERPATDTRHQQRSET
jgi:hypothetical protein